MQKSLSIRLLMALAISIMAAQPIMAVKNGNRRRKPEQTVESAKPNDDSSAKSDAEPAETPVVDNSSSVKPTDSALTTDDLAQTDAEPAQTPDDTDNLTAEEMKSALEKAKAMNTALINNHKKLESAISQANDRLQIDKKTIETQKDCAVELENAAKSAVSDLEKTIETGKNNADALERVAVSSINDLQKKLDDATTALKEAQKPADENFQARVDADTERARNEMVQLQKQVASLLDQKKSLEGQLDNLVNERMNLASELAVKTKELTNSQDVDAQARLKRDIAALEMKNVVLNTSIDLWGESYALVEADLKALQDNPAVKSALDPTPRWKQCNWNNPLFVWGTVIVASGTYFKGIAPLLEKIADGQKGTMKTVLKLAAANGETWANCGRGIGTGASALFGKIMGKKAKKAAIRKPVAKTRRNK